MIKPLPPPDAFLRAAESLAIRFDSNDLERLGLFLALLLDANRRFNLTAIVEPDEAWHKHILDSLTLMPFLDAGAGPCVIDLGTGGGLPGIPLAVALPHLTVDLLEATGKKARYLRDTITALGLTNCHVVNLRAEAAAHDREHHRDRYDAVIARALGKLPGLLELALPFAAVGGRVLAIKGARANAEVSNSTAVLRDCGGVVEGVHPTPTGRIVVIQKVGMTPPGYPRRSGEPWKEPWRPLRSGR
jgi:16S rRNA (guanine527-N7)-methyltransferase